MILRKIRESEFRRAEEVFHLSFEFPLTEEKTSEEMRRERAEAPLRPVRPAVWRALGRLGGRR